MSNVHRIHHDSNLQTWIDIWEICNHAADSRSYHVVERDARPGKQQAIIREQRFTCTGYFDLSRSTEARALARTWRNS